jgi:hypothetical protein
MADDDDDVDDDGNIGSDNGNGGDDAVAITPPLDPEPSLWFDPSTQLASRPAVPITFLLLVLLPWMHRPVFKADARPSSHEL